MPPANRTLDFYNANAEELTRAYDRVEFGGYIDLLCELVPPPARHLEIGCGSGRDAARAAARGYDVTILDGSESMLTEAARLHPELGGRTVHVVLPAPLPFADGAFDVVASWATLMHLPEADLPEVLREVARVLRPGGVFTWSVNTARAELDETGADPRGRHFTCLSAERWQSLHEAAGFTTIRREETDDVVGRAGVRWVTLVGRRYPGIQSGEPPAESDRARYCTVDDLGWPVLDRPAHDRTMVTDRYIDRLREQEGI